MELLLVARPTPNTDACLFSPFTTQCWEGVLLLLGVPSLFTVDGHILLVSRWYTRTGKTNPCFCWFNSILGIKVKQEKTVLWLFFMIKPNSHITVSLRALSWCGWLMSIFKKWKKRSILFYHHTLTLEPPGSSVNTRQHRYETTENTDYILLSYIVLTDIIVQGMLTTLYSK